MVSGTEQPRQEARAKELSRVRAATLAAGGLLTAGGLRRGGLIGIASAAIGGNLLYEGVKGNSPLFQALRINRGPMGSSAAVPHGQSSKAEALVIIDRPREELFAFWRDFKNLPRFMEYLEAVEVIDHQRSRWTLRLPVGQLVWEAETYQEQAGELLSWRSMPDAPLSHAGTMRFEDATGGRGTKVSLIMSYSPPLGRLGAAAATLLPQSPSHMASDALRKFKQLMETGEIMTSRIRHDAMSNQLEAAGTDGSEGSAR